MTRLLDSAAELADLVGEELGTSDWIILDQARIDAFARLTGDDHWIHIDPARAARELVGGKTIAHGFLALSLVPFLQREIFTVRQRGKGINYGCDRVRFVSPIPVDSRMRLRQTVQRCIRLPDSTRIHFASTLEIEGQPRPAVVAETIVQIYDR
jgi:acyl dehydratase